MQTTAITSENEGTQALDDQTEKLKGILKTPTFPIRKTNSDYLSVKLTLDGRTHIDTLKPDARERLQQDSGVDLQGFSDEQILELLVQDKRVEISDHYKGLLIAFTLNKFADPEFTSTKYNDFFNFLTSEGSSFNFMSLADFDYLKDFLTELIVMARSIVANIGTSKKEDDIRLAKEFFERHKIPSDSFYSFEYAYDKIKAKLTPQ